MTEVTELTGAEGGIWRITTHRSMYVMDLDRGTVTRDPGPQSNPTVNDTTRRIRSIDRCRTGEGGYWTMKSGGYMDPVDFYWQSTSVIRGIERVDDAAQDAATGSAGDSQPPATL